MGTRSLNFSLLVLCGIRVEGFREFVVSALRLRGVLVMIRALSFD